MGYTLIIGEPSIYINKEENHLSIDVKIEKHDQAPAYGEPTDHENQRWPSYISWRKFCLFVGLQELFYDEDYGLMRSHPGEMLLLNTHKNQIDLALEKFKKQYPNVVAGYSPKIDPKKGIYEDKAWPPENSYMVRLEWLKYWIDWALENCDQPIFKNY